MATNQDTSPADLNKKTSGTDPFFSKNYASKLTDGAKEGLVFGVKLAAVAAPFMIVSGLLSWIRRD